MFKLLSLGLEVEGLAAVPGHSRVGGGLDLLGHENRARLPFPLPSPSPHTRRLLGAEHNHFARLLGRADPERHCPGGEVSLNFKTSTLNPKPNKTNPELNPQTLNPNLQTLSPKPQSRARHKCATVDGALFLFSGQDMYKYTLETHEWSLIPVQGTTPPDLGTPCMVSERGLLWLYGGSSLWVFDPTKGSWHDSGNLVKSFPPSRDGAECLAVDGRIYVLSGRMSDAATVADGRCARLFAAGERMGGCILDDLWVLAAAEGALRLDTALVWKPRP